MICFHSWGKWAQKEIKVDKPVKINVPAGEYYKGPVTIGFKELWQSRTCKKCGKMQMEYIR